MLRAAAVIMTGFAAVWWIVGTTGSGWDPIFSFGIPAVICAAILAPAWKRRMFPELASAEDVRRVRRLVVTISSLGALAMIIAMFALHALRSPGLGTSATIVIVGISFLALGRGLQVRLYFGTGCALVLLGIAGFFVGNAATRRLVVSIGTAAVLWLTSVAVLTRRKGPQIPDRYHELLDRLKPGL